MIYDIIEANKFDRTSSQFRQIYSLQLFLSTHLTRKILSGHPWIFPFNIAVNIRCFAPGCS